jgi:hypothetical protein
MLKGRLRRGAGKNEEMGIASGADYCLLVIPKDIPNPTNYPIRVLG